jgi:hypothetical protein
MNNLSKDKRNRIMLIGIGTVAAAIGIWQAMIVAQQASFRDLEKRIADQKSRLDGAQRLVDSQAQLQRDLEAASGKLKVAEAEMASGDMYSWVIQTVNKFREGYKVEIPQYSRETPCEVGVIPQFPYKAVMFSLKGSAHFHEFGRFLADFENRFPYLRVQKLELDPMGVSSSTAPGRTVDADEAEKLAFKMEVVALVNPQSR